MSIFQNIIVFLSLKFDSLANSADPISSGWSLFARVLLRGFWSKNG